MDVERLRSWQENDSIIADHCNVGISRDPDTGELRGISLMLTVEGPMSNLDLQVSGIIAAENTDNFVDAVQRCARIIKGEDPIPDMGGPASG